MDLVVRKAPGPSLIPANEETAAKLQKMKLGQVAHGNFRTLRNPEFLAKFMVLVRFLYDHWDPGEFQDPKWQGVKPEKSFERFRKDLIILAGFYEASYRVDKTIRIEARSISFANMSEEDFEKLYSQVINVGLQRILPSSYTSEKLRKVIDELLSFS